jgi:hypothetical protein
VQPIGGGVVSAHCASAHAITFSLAIPNANVISVTLTNANANTNTNSGTKRLKGRGHKRNQLL